MTTRSGLIAGGNWIVDQVKLIDAWPAQDSLATVLDQSLGNGGSPYNVLKDLAKLGAPFPLEAVGLIGDDDHGRWIRADCARHGIDARQLQSDPRAATSYTDVMTVRSTGRRTFFHQAGANALLAPEHFDFRATTAKHFHFGYLLLLAALDAKGADGAPRALEVFRAARQQGLTTSLDLVSTSPERLAREVLPVLPGVDVLFVNDYEATHVTGIPVRAGERIDAAAVMRSARSLLAAGVQQRVVIHFPEGAYACEASGHGAWQPALNIAPEQIKGAAGAGDAFAAGVLLGWHEQWSVQRSLILGVAAAATSLFHPTCSEGVRSQSECLRFADEVGFQPTAADWRSA